MNINQEVVDSAIVCAKVVGYPSVIVLGAMIIGLVGYAIFLKYRTCQLQQKKKNSVHQKEERA